MIYYFNRDNEAPSAWNGIIRKMSETLAQVKLHRYSRETLKAFCKRAVEDAEELPGKPQYLFWGFDEPSKMPSDSRCAYFYQPSYLMTLTLVNAVLQYPDLIELDGMRDTLKRGLCGCTGRSLQGSGFESTTEQHENLRIFLYANIIEFIKRYPDLSEAFHTVLNEIMSQMQTAYINGSHIRDWGHDFKEEQAELLELYEACCKDAGLEM